MTEAITNQLPEIIGAVLESITALSAVSRQQHIVHLCRYSRDEAIPDIDAVAFFEREKEKAEQDMERANADLDQRLRKLEAIKLILEGKTAEEIRATFAERDAVLTAFKEKIGATHETDKSLAATGR